MMIQLDGLECSTWINKYHREGNLIGFLSYSIDYYSSNAYNFGLVSFDKGNPIIGRDLFNKLEELVSTLHRVE